MTGSQVHSGKGFELPPGNGDTTFDAWMASMGSARRQLSALSALLHPVSFTNRSYSHSCSDIVRRVGQNGDSGDAPTKRPSSRPPYAVR